MSLPVRIRPGRWAFCGATALATFALTGVGLAPAVLAGATQSVDESVYALTARADALSLEAVQASAPVVPNGQVLFATPSTSQATIDSLGTSNGYASAPYPGETAVTLPGVVTALAGVPLPTYPFYVSSNYPAVPSAAAAMGPFEAESQSSASQSAAQARVMLTPNDSPAAFTSKASTSVSRDAASGTLAAEARSLVEGFAMGPQLSIGTISSFARLTRAGGAAPSKETSFSVGSITVAGMTYGLTDKGFEPLGAAPDTAPVTQLEALGISIRYLPARETATHIESAGLAVGLTGELPSQGPAGLTFIFGRVSATLDGSAVPAGAATAGTDVVAPGQTGINPTSDGEAEVGVPVDAAAGVLPVTSLGNPGAPVPVLTGGQPTALAGAVRPMLGDWSEAPYLALALGLLAAGATAVLVAIAPRLLGRTSTATSPLFTVPSGG